MPTPPASPPIAMTVAPISTPAVTLPCGIKVPSIPLTPKLTYSITLPTWAASSTKKPKKGPSPSRKESKLAAMANKLKKMCNADLPTPRS